MNEKSSHCNHYCQSRRRGVKLASARFILPCLIIPILVGLTYRSITTNGQDKQYSSKLFHAIRNFNRGEKDHHGVSFQTT